MIGKNRQKIETAYSAIIISALFMWTSLAYANSSIVDKRLAAKIAKEKGVLKPAEVLNWKIEQKDIPKDWVKIDNKYFSVYYPKCFNIEGEEGESDPKISPSIFFNRTEKCPDYSNKGEEFNYINIRYDYLYNIDSIDKITATDHVLFRQLINVNGLKGAIWAGLMDHYDEKNKQYFFKLRHQLYVRCKSKSFLIIRTLPPGAPSMEKVNKSDYQLPEDFKKIISTFQCKE